MIIGKMATVKLFSLSVVQLLVGISLQSQECQVYPSEYAYHGDSVNRAETASANCRNYTHGLALQLASEHYIHCDGKQLRLADSNFGTEQYSSSYYYEWRAGLGTRQLLFIFPTRVNLTTITLHYYSDSQRGLPRLRFYAAPYDFDAWDAPPGNSRYVDIAAVPPGAETAGHRSVSINVNFITKKILMVKLGSTFKLAVSEVEFLIYNVATVQTEINLTSSTNALQTTAMFTKAEENTGTAGTTTVNKAATKTDYSGDPRSTSTITMSEAIGVSLTNDSDTLNLIIGVVIAILILVLLAAIALTVIVVMSRKSAKRKSNCDSSYSVLSRGTPQQLQPQAVHNSSELYDQIHLSPLTGQAEFIRNNETENPQSQQGNRPSIEEQPLQVSLQTAGLNESSENASNTEQPTYAVVNKKQKKKKHTVGKELVPDQKCEAQNEDLRNVKKHKKEISDTKKVSPSKEIESLDQLYTVVKKKPKRSAADEDKNAPPVPPHTVEELYTAVNKVSKVRAATKEEEAPPIPSHTVEELYAAVNKTLKGNAADDEEEAPPIPPHTEDM